MLTRCPKHGRVYDDATERACPLCLKGAPAEGAGGSDGSSRGTLIRLGVLAGLLGVAGAVWWFGLRTPPPPPPPAPVVVDTMALLDAGEAYADSSDRRPIRQARAFAAALERVYGDRGTVLGLSAGPRDTADADRAAARNARQYAQFAGRWHARLDAAKPDSQLFYRPGARFAEQLETVNNYLGAARSAMRQAVPRGAVPPAGERRNYFQSARGYLNSARTVLSELP